jgi:branched-chain amino acid aminotransferase
MKELQTSTAYFRNEFVAFQDAHLSIASAPVLYGLSTYTVIPVFWNQQMQTLAMFRLKDHYKRLQNSCKILAFDDFIQSWDYQKFKQTMSQLLVKNNVKQDSLVRVTVFVDDILKGTRMHGLKHSLSAFVYSLAPLLPNEGAHCMVSSWRRTPDNAVPARAKINGGYVNAALMKHEAITNGFDDAIALDEQGHVTESTVANIFLVRDGQLITPGNSADLLEGITRDSIYRFADHLKLGYEQRTIDRSELYIADEILFCASSMNIIPVLSVDHRKIGSAKVGPVTKQLMTIYEDGGHHRSDLFSDWLTPVATS